MTVTAVRWDLLLERVEEATRLLRASAAVPAEVEDLVDSLGAALPAGPVRLDADPYLVAALSAAAYRAQKALRRPDARSRRRDLRVALEQFRHALRDIVAGQPFDSGAPVGEVLDRTVATLSVPQREVASLLGVSTRQLQRWLNGEGGGPAGADEARVRVVGQLVDQLRHSFTGPGVLAWFGRDHPVLGGAPAAWLADPLRYPELVAAARASRAMTG